MGKTGKWIRNFLTGKKDKDREKKATNYQQTIVANGHPMTPVITPQTTPKEKKRWSFRRSSAEAPGQQALMESEDEQKKHALAVAAATAAAAHAALAAAKAAAAAVVRLTATAASSGRATEVEEAAARKIQSHYRGYLARKALNALKGLVKLQALARGHLVRRQAAATLRCMQALITAQSRAREQRLRMVEEPKFGNKRQFNHRKSTHENRSRPPYIVGLDFDRTMEQDIKIVEMDLGESKGSVKSRKNYSIHTNMDRLDHLIATHPGAKLEHQQISAATSAITDFSPRACSAHFEDHSYGTAQSSPQHYSISKPDNSRIPLDYARSEYADSQYNEYRFYPSYMANTESSRAKVRSHSAPKQRPESLERQPSRRRQSLEGRNVPRGVRMLRSSSHDGSTGQTYQYYPWPVKLDRSTVSVKDSECGSTSTVVTNANYRRSLV